LSDRSRRPVRYANQLPPQIESLIVAAKRDNPHWGARKIRSPTDDRGGRRQIKRITVFITRLMVTTHIQRGG
jgi:hypothetical protein